MDLHNYLIIFVLLWLPTNLFAAEENKQSNTVETQEKTATTKPTVGKRARVKTLKEFIPSEEVSADKSVAFPSDI